MLAAVIPYFNPAGYKRRLMNCQIVIDEYKRLGANLFVIELAINEFQIPEANWKLKTSSCMFHKEHLINFAVDKLPPKYDNILWADADMLPFRRSWFNMTDKALNDFEVVQAFKRVCFNNHDDEPEIGTKVSKKMLNVQSLAAGGSKDAIGYAWAARREIFKHGLYPYAITGSGDVLFVHGIMDNIERWDRIVNEEARPKYLKWKQEIGLKQVGFVECDLLHLWHGNLENRLYRDRHQILRDSKFDPDSDLALNQDRMMEFSGNNPNLKEKIWDYFQYRREDSIT